MRPLRIDMVTERLEGGHPEVLKGNDIHTPVFRFEGQIAGGVRTIQIPTKMTNTLVFRNDSFFPIAIIVRDAGAALVQSIVVAPDSDALMPIVRAGAAIDFINPDTSRAEVTALFF